MRRQVIFWRGAAVLAVLGACCFAVNGMRFSGALCWAAALLLIGLAILEQLAETKPKARTAERVLAALAGTGLLFFLLLEVQVISGSVPDDTDPDVSCVLILGAGVNGTEPSLILAQRLNTALAYLLDKPDIPILVSGCRGLGEDITEAECMARYLVSHGVEPERIWKEEQASSTRTNFEYSLAMMREGGIDTAQPFACVTSDFHIARSRFIASRQGVARDGLVCISASLPDGAYYAALTLNYYIREAFALVNEMLMGVDLDL